MVIRSSGSADAASVSRAWHARNCGATIVARRATKKPVGETDVESYKHKEAKRKNIPTAELQKLVPDDDKAIKTLR
jgi:hypothetical protein